MAGKATKPKEGAAVGRKPIPKVDDPAQSKRFIDVAREADESNEGANRAFRKVAKARPQSKAKGHE